MLMSYIMKTIYTVKYNIQLERKKIIVIQYGMHKCYI